MKMSKYEKIGFTKKRVLPARSARDGRAGTATVTENPPVMPLDPSVDLTCERRLPLLLAASSPPFLGFSVWKPYFRFRV